MNEFNPQTGFHSYYVYIITNTYRSTFYIGMTNNLKERLNQHKENLELGNKTFASKYNLEFLVYYEKFVWVEEAIAREKEINVTDEEMKTKIKEIVNKSPNIEDKSLFENEEWKEYVRRIEEKEKAFRAFSKEVLGE